ncbi:hypothetical protein C7S13_7096 [Burkholderia cepacia]|nr:hypothetical protein [Burkholderia cepacia]
MTARRAGADVGACEWWRGRAPGALKADAGACVMCAAPA